MTFLDKFKEENWNLEVTLQDLRAQLAEAQSAALRGESETKRLTKLLASTRESNDSQKNEVERLKATMEEMKAKHETDVANHRKQNAALARDKSDLQQALDTYKAEVARAGRRLPRFGSPMSPSVLETPKMEDEDDPFSIHGTSTNRRRIDNSSLFPPESFDGESAESSPEPSPSRSFLAPNHPSNEIEALQQKLAHAQRQVSTLKGSLAREKEMRMDYRRKLLDAGIDVEKNEDDDDGEYEIIEEESAPKARSKSVTLRGRGRGRGLASGMRSGGSRLTLAHKLGMAAMHPSSSDEEEEDAQTPVEISPVALSIPDLHVSDDVFESPASTTRNAPTSPSPVRSADDSMDPDFANVLQRASSNGSMVHTSSPRRGGARGGRGGAVGRRRGGTASQEPRPSSLVGQPEALALELGIGMESVAEVEPVKEKETAEFACQTDSVEPPAPPPPAPELPVLVIPERETSEFGVQVDAPMPEPVIVTVEVPKLIHVEPTPEPAAIKIDTSSQTDVPVRTETGISTDPPVVPVMVDTSTFTEAHILVPTSEAEVQTPHAEKVDLGTQTPAPPVIEKAEIEIQTVPVPEQIREVIQEVVVRPRTPERSEAETQTSPLKQVFETTPRASTSAETGYARARYLSTASTVTGVPRLSLDQVVRGQSYDQDDDVQTEIGGGETEPEAETDMELYHDARSIAPTPSATDSVADFHSISTMTDNEFSSEDEIDIESIKASHLRPGTRSSRASSIVQSDVDSEGVQDLTVTYESQGVETEPIPVEIPVKKTLSEMATQTDEWQPPAPSPIVPPAGFGLYKVGAGGQQFQFVTPPPPSTAPASPIATPSTSYRDSTATLGTTPVRPIRFSSLTNDLERRKSIESTKSGVATPEIATRQHTQSLGPTMAPQPVDKTRPPTMVLPPPPRMPPPPNSMPPPSFIPEKRRPASALSNHREVPPPRPSSPPPPELIQRATTPTFGTALAVPGGRPQRQHAGSVPPLGSNVRQLSSTASFRSAANDALSAAAILDGSTRSRNRNIRSATSLLSDPEDVASRRSSISSDFHPRMPEADTTMNTTATANRTNLSATDPTVIHSITQTMIGEFLYKYTRKAIGKGHGERRHKRFFWVHPYTRTLYWSSADPGSTNVTEQNAKSGKYLLILWLFDDGLKHNLAYIDSVRSVLDPNPMPPGLHQYSVIISTPQREMKLTAPTKERHDIWLNVRTEKSIEVVVLIPAP